MTPSSASTAGLGGGGALYRPAVSPHDPDLIFVQCDMGGLYRSTDRGASWRLVDGRDMTASLTPRDPTNCPVVFHPVDPDIVYAAADYRGLRHSPDRGDTWSTDIADPAGTLAATAIALDSASGALRFYGRATADPATSGVWRPGDPTPMLPGGSVVDFVANGTNGTWYVALRGPVSAATPRVFRLDPGAVGWQPLPVDGLPAGVEVRSFAGGTAGGSTMLYVTVRSDPLTATSAGGVYRLDVAGGTGWQRRMGPGINDTVPATPDADAPCPVAAQYDWLGVAATDPDVVYVTVCGTTATPSVKDADVHLHSGVFRSTDGGAAWSHIYHYADPQAAQQAPEFNLTGGWVDWDRSWGSGGPARVRAENDDLAGGFGISPVQPDVAVFCNKMALYITDDGLGPAVTWRQAYTKQAPGQGLPAQQQAWQSIGLEVTTAWHYEIDPADSTRHFICYTDIGLARSRDGGATWTYRPPRRRRPHMGRQRVADYNSVYQLAFDDSTPTRIWAACSDQHDIPYPDWVAVRNGGGVARSDDGGADWHDFSGDLPVTAFRDAAPPPVTSIVLDQATRRVYTAVYGHGVFLSDDASARTPADPPPTWQKVASTGMAGDNPNVYRLTLHGSGDLFCSVTAAREWTPHPSDPRRGTYGKFLQTADGGLWRLPKGSSTWSR